MVETIERHSPLLLIAGTALLSGAFVWLLTLGVTGLATPASVTEAPCQESGFTCYTFDAPLDHTDPDGHEPIPVTFAVEPARGESHGAFVYAGGGPGSPYVAYADSLYGSLTPGIRQNFDVVFFDLRGIEISDTLLCGAADATFSADYDDLPTDPAARWEALSPVIARYNEDCRAGMLSREVLPYLDTEQAAADLEMFREHMGYDRLIIYGESYGTKLAQVYATLYPESTERLVLDGTIDLSRDDTRFSIDRLEAVDIALDAVFAACEADEWCSGDFPAGPRATYDALAASLAVAPRMVDFPFDADTTERIPFTVEDLGSLAFFTSYDETDRMLFLRALASYNTTGDLVPLTRFWFTASSSDLVDAVFDSFTCNDASYPGNDPTTEAALLSAARDTVRPDQRWMFEGDLTCLSWPDVDHGQPVHGPFVGEGIPTLIVASELDVTTPYSHSVGVFEHLDEGHLLSVAGGTHVMFGRGIDCVDDAVTAFVVDGSEPDTTRCSVEPVAPYATILPQHLYMYSTEELLFLAEHELTWFPELNSWDSFGPMTVGCTESGDVTFTGDGGWQIDFELVDCGLAKGLTVTGTGTFDYDSGVTELDVVVAGHDCPYRYQFRWEDEDTDVEEVCT